MSLHSSKEQALIQLTNCMPFCNVKTIKQLSDGKIFLTIIETVFPEKTLHLRNEEKETLLDDEHSKKEDKTMNQDSNMSENDSQKEQGSVVESSKDMVTTVGNEPIAAETKFTDATSEDKLIDVVSVEKSPEKISINGKNVISSATDTASPSIKNVDVQNEDLSERYEFIEVFIDEKYNLQSRKLITYKDCMAENEFELAKVTLFVLSEVVRHYVRVNNSIIQTLLHMDTKVQQDLEDCFNLFINDRSKITKTDLKKLLSTPASYKVSPVKNSFVTPKRSCSSKYKRSPSSSPLQDSNFIDSPLKTYFDSPIFTKKDIITKEKEILKTRQNLYEEETKSNTFQLKVKELEKELKKKDIEIKNLKTEIKEFQETEKPKDCENCAILDKCVKAKEKELREFKSIKDEQFVTLVKEYEDQLEDLKVRVASQLSVCKYEFQQAESRCQDLENEKDDIQFELLKREQDIERLKEELKLKTKECEITKEKLSAALIENEKIPEYSICSEPIGGFIEKENEELRERVKQLELIAVSKEIYLVDAMVQCTENSMDYKVVENSIVSKNELSPTPDVCEKAESVIIEENLQGCPNVFHGEPIKEFIEKENEELKERVKQLELAAVSKKTDMVDAMVQCTENSLVCKVVENSVVLENELPPTPNFCEKAESVITEENLQECPDVCDIDRRDSSISLSSGGPIDAVPFTPNNLSPVKNDCVGALWQQYNDSMTENESANEVLILHKCVDKILSSLQKFETKFLLKQNYKRIKISPRANGSNGLVSSSLIKELMEDFKSVKKSLLCLSKVVEKRDVEIQNNITMSESSEVIGGNDCSSNTAVNSQCDMCLRKKEELPSSVLSSLSQDSEALLEKTKEFDILNEQYMTTVASLRLKEKELNAYKRKYFYLKTENVQNVKILKDSEIKYQKLQLERKDAKKTEFELKKTINKEREFFRTQAKELSKKYSTLAERYFTVQAENESLHAMNQKLEDDVVTYRTQNQELARYANVLKNLQEFGPCAQSESSSNTEQETRIVPFTPGPMSHFAQGIPGRESFSPNENEASSVNADIEENFTASALYARNLQNPFQLHTADEESFLNHSSIAGLSRNYESEDSLNRVQELNRRNTVCMPQYESYISSQNGEENAPNRVVELNRRNTLCMPHLRSCYPAEGVPLNPPSEHSSNYVEFETADSANNDRELRSKAPAGKKRKVSEMKAGDQLSDVVKTPYTKYRMKFRTPQKLHNLLNMKKRQAPIKPKP